MNEKEYLVPQDKIIETMNGYHNQEEVIKVPKMVMSQDTYNYLMVENLVSLGLLSDDVQIDESVENGFVRITVDEDAIRDPEPVEMKKVHHQSKYTKKKYVYKKKHSGCRKNRRK